MRPVPVAGQAERGPIVSSALVFSSLAVLSLTVLTGASTREVTAVVLVVTTMAVAYRWLLSWKALLALMVLIILFIPIRRYGVAGDLPFSLEPYRAFVALLFLAWVGSLLVDRRVRLRRTGFEGPFALIWVAVLGSIIANAGAARAMDTELVKKLMFFASFIIVVYVVVSVARRFEAIDFLAKALVFGGAVVAAFAIVESRTGYNVFNHLESLPLLREGEMPVGGGRGARLRVFASAQHPIALGAALVLLTPLAIYLAQRYRKPLWWVSGLLLGMGVLATVSRTAIVMLFVVAAVFLWLRPKQTRRFWPALVPALLVVHVALPGTLGSLKQSFLPAGGLIAEQNQVGGTGQGRIADIDPAMVEFKRKPVVGKGFGTHVVGDAAEGGQQILDNQWLGTMLETGLLGLFGWLWLFVRAVRRFGAAARRDDSDRGWLLAAAAAAVAAYAVGMLTYDAFAFIQVTFLLFILIGLGAAALGTDAGAPAGRRAEGRASGRALAAARRLQSA